MEKLYKPLRAAHGYLEIDETTFSSVYPCFVSVTAHLAILDDATKTVLGLCHDTIKDM